jgi:hypothetical protein
MLEFYKNNTKKNFGFTLLGSLTKKLDKNYHFWQNKFLQKLPFNISFLAVQKEG